MKRNHFLVTHKSNPKFKLYNTDPISFLNNNALLTSYIDDRKDRPSKKKIRDLFKKTWEVNNLSLQIDLLVQGLGVTFLPETILKSHPKAKKLTVLSKFPFYEIKKPYGLYYAKDKLSDPAELFISLSKKKWL